MRRKTVWKWSIGAALVAGAGLTLLYVDTGPHEEYVPEPALAEAPVGTPPPPSTYGIPLDGLRAEHGVLKEGETFGALLGAKGIPMATVNHLAQLAGPQFDLRRLRSGHPYTFLLPVAGSEPRWFVYHIDPVQYIVFRLHGEPEVTIGHRPVTTTEAGFTCVVSGALYNDVAKAGADPLIAVLLAEIYAWTVDFMRMQKDDRFTVLYSQRRVEGDPVGQPLVLAARYSGGGRILEAYRFEAGGEGAYYDAQGNSLRKAFLKAPLKFSRISSGYSHKRLHPVQKVLKAHLGTDYAAPYGTPILAVGDGIVEKAGHGAGNGNFVTIRHNATYSTQYLHMRRILVKAGQRVRQGDVIGEVGSTGLATGPHVCFRFWKNGRQVDHRREEFPSTEPVPQGLRPDFDRLQRAYAARLDAIEQEAAQSRLVEF